MILFGWFISILPSLLQILAECERAYGSFYFYFTNEQKILLDTVLLQYEEKCGRNRGLVAMYKVCLISYSW